MTSGIFVLFLVYSVYRPMPANVSASEFHSKEACEIALTEAKKYFVIINSESRCIDVIAEFRKQQLKLKLKELEK